MLHRLKHNKTVTEGPRSQVKHMNLKLSKLGGTPVLVLEEQVIV